jgi:SAM-dependent methyltransferase
MPTGQMILSCAFCGMVYASTSAPDYAQLSIYVDASLYGGPDHQARHRRMIKRLAHISGPVVDIGCATGELLAEFAAAGWTVKGISVSPDEVACCNARGLDAETRSITDPDKEYNLVILSHVLEHVTNVRGFLADLRDWVGGSLYVEVPDATLYPEYIHSISQGFNLEHINHFSLYHLVRVVSEAGFILRQSGTERGENPDCRMIWGIFEKAFPETLAFHVGAYAARLNEELDAIKDKVDVSRPMALWGVGQAAEILTSMGVQVSAATDSNASYWGREKFGVVVVRPEEFKPADPILVCSQVSKDAIVKRIQKLGLTNEVITI